MNAEQINELAKTIHEQNRAVGWWDNPNRCLLECLQLISTEVAEATEAARKDLMDDHLPHRKGEEVELADAMIRLLDLGGSQGWLYRVESELALSDATVARMRERYSIGALHFLINEAVVMLGQALDVHSPYLQARRYSLTIDKIITVAKARGCDLWGAVAEKSEYNRQRQDHTRESRALAGGKKF